MTTWTIGAAKFYTQGDCCLAFYPCGSNLLKTVCGFIGRRA